MPALVSAGDLLSPMVNMPHPSYYMNHNPIESCFRHLQILEFAQACGVRGKKVHGWQPFLTIPLPTNNGLYKAVDPPFGLSRKSIIHSVESPSSITVHVSKPIL
jgi:hypothetical protein